jgi:DNA-binding NarL/FixJ family response regulator
MSATPILTVTGDSTFLEMLRAKLRDQLGQQGRFVVTPSLDEATTLLKSARPRLVVVHLASDGGHYDGFDRLLWATSVFSRPTPVVVVAERYLTEQATTLYRMGVAEYISRTHHLDQLGDVLASYVRPETFKTPESSVSEPAAANGWRANQSAKTKKARVV